MLHWLPKRHLSKRFLFAAQLLAFVFALHLVVVIGGWAFSKLPGRARVIAIRQVRLGGTKAVTVVDSQQLLARRAADAARSLKPAPPIEAPAKTMPKTADEPAKKAVEVQPKLQPALAAPTPVASAVPEVKKPQRVPAPERAATKVTKDTKPVEPAKPLAQPQPKVAVKDFNLDQIVVAPQKKTEVASFGEPVAEVRPKATPLGRILETAVEREQEVEAKVQGFEEGIDDLEAEVIAYERDYEFIQGLNSAWHPPLGVEAKHPCMVEVTVAERGQIASVNVLSSSGVASYDASVCLAIREYAFPNWLWSTRVQLTFGE